MSKFDRGMEMEEKNFATQVIETIKGNAFIIRKILFNIDDCVPKSDLEEARGKISQLEKIVGNQREELKRGQNSLRQAQEKISKLGIELEKTNTRLVQFKEKYFEIEQAFSSYENLSDSTKFALEGVFGAGNSPTNFLAGALQEGHLESLFDYVANTLNSGNNLNEIKTLALLQSTVVGAKKFLLGSKFTRATTFPARKCAKPLTVRNQAQSKKFCSLVINIFAQTKLLDLR